MPALLTPLRRTGEPGAASRLAAPGKRRSIPYAVLGIVLVAACALGFLVTSVSLGARSAVLAVAGTVKAGQVITAGDLRSVQVAAGPGVAVIPVSEQSSVIGRTAAVTLTAGSLLTRSELGASTVPGANGAVVSVLVKFGAYPVDLSAGARVAVATGSAGSGAASNATAGAGAVPLSGDPQATVLAVTASGSGDGSAAVELQTDSVAAAAIAAIPSGQSQLITIAGGA